MIKIISDTFIYRATKSGLSQFLLVLSFLILLSAIFEWEEYILNPILKLDEMESTYGTVHTVRLGKFRSLGLFGESYNISKAKINKKALKNKQAKIWYQEQKRLFGDYKIIYQIKTSDWVMRKDYSLYYKSKIEHRKYSILILTLHILIIFAIFYFIWYRHKDEMYNKTE